jgi:two-component system, chemotaxis family, chemotaxis protein CheY
MRQARQQRSTVRMPVKRDCRMAGNNLKILVVDDFPIMVKIMRKLLKQIGYDDVDEAANGQDAFAKVSAKTYDLIVSDWNMEPMTGFELLQKVRALPAIARTPFILVTAESKAENLVAAKNAGVTGYLIKPFNEKSLKEKIDLALAAVPV